MSEQKYYRTRRAVFNLTVHIVLVTKYRKKVISGERLTRLREIFHSVCKSWESELIEFKGEVDHVHLMVTFPPHKRLSDLISNLKATSSKTMWREFGEALQNTYQKKGFWTGSYFVASCGGVTIKELKQYVEKQSSPDSSHQQS